MASSWLSWVADVAVRNILAGRVPGRAEAWYLDEEGASIPL
jgi:hypothetical protein